MLRVPSAEITEHAGVRVDAAGHPAARVIDTALMPGRYWTADGSFFGLDPFPTSKNKHRSRSWNGSAATSLSFIRGVWSPRDHLRNFGQACELRRNTPMCTKKERS